MEPSVEIVEHTLAWEAGKGEMAIDTTLDVRVHKLQSDKVVIILPGVDGSVDGFENKYVRMADNITSKQRKAVVRLSNPFISYYHWEDNLREALAYVEENAQELFGTEEISIEIIGHSAGAAAAASLAWEYPAIKKLLLINTAAAVSPEKIVDGLRKYTNEAKVIFGSKDPSLPFAAMLPEEIQVDIIEGADHHFTGEHLETFITLPDLLGEKQ